jgi:hypothetical protein
MTTPIKAFAVASAVVASLAVAPALYAHDAERSGDSMMGSGMMQQMSGMMEGCGKMMQSSNPSGSERPNEQWRKDAPQDGRTTGTSG